MIFPFKPVAFFFLLFFSLGQEAKAEILSGVVLNRLDTTPIENVHVINTTSKRGVVSNAEGEFTIAYQLGDTITLSAIGFHTRKVKITNPLKSIYMDRKKYDLEPHTVLPYKNFDAFKGAFLDLETCDTAPRINPSIYLSKDALSGGDIVFKNGAIVLNGAISKLLTHFNKYLREEKKIKSFITQEARVTKKFNSELVGRITGIRKEENVKEFMEYCDFTPAFILSSSEYELVDQVIKCHDEFRSVSIVSD